MKIRTAVTMVGLLLGAASNVAHAAPIYTYLGSYAVDDGPDYVTEPHSYTGQQAAALLFGGSASDYAISTIGSDPGDINF